jgi:replication factor C subunit 3/5
MSSFLPSSDEPDAKAFSRMSHANESAASDRARRVEQSTAFLPWIEKYRPNSLDELISQGEIISTISKLIQANRLPHMLFYGPPGTGKTSTILAIAKQLYGPSYSNMTLELNASDDRGIDVVREQIKSFAGTQKLFSKGVKLIILDEADAMTADAQFALRRVIEKYAKNARFCLICNYVSKIIPALQSRCTRFRFAPLEAVQIKSRLQYILEKESLYSKVTPEALSSILDLSSGDMRRVLNILQSCASSYDSITEEVVYRVTGKPLPSEIQACVEVLLNSDFQASFEHVHGLTRKGYAISDLIQDISKLITRSNLPALSKTLLFDKMADLEHRLAYGTSDKIQTAALVGAFQLVRANLRAP